MDPIIGSIILFAFPRIPDNFLPCDGRALPIATFSALFSVIGTTYGGDGAMTFNLPDLRGRVPVHRGQAPGLPPYVLGAAGGSEMVTLTPDQIAQHAHPLMAAGVVPPSGPS